MTSAPPSTLIAPPLLSLERVHARDASGPGRRSRGRLVDAAVALPPGVVALLGAPEDGTLALVDVIGGQRKPTRGKVTLGGRELFRSPAARARVGALAAEPHLLPGRTVADSIRSAMCARGESPHAIDGMLDPLGIGRLHARRVGSLSFAEARAVELALASRRRRRSSSCSTSRSSTPPSPSPGS